MSMPGPPGAWEILRKAHAQDQGQEAKAIGGLERLLLMQRLLQPLVCGSDKGVRSSALTLHNLRHRVMVVGTLRKAGWRTVQHNSC